MHFFITENTFSDDTQKNHYYLFHSWRQEQYSLLARDGSIWLNQNQMAEFFDTSTPNISIHISEILKDKALQENSVVKHYLTTASDGKIIWLRSILWRRSLQLGSECAVLRQWANRNLEEYMHKGFVMDDECLKKQMAARMILMNCWNVSVISGLLKNVFTRKFEIFLLWAAIINKYDQVC